MRLADINIADEVAKHVAQCDDTEQTSLLTTFPLFLLEFQ